MSVVPSAACCSVPPVETGDYKEKGKYTEVAGLKTYVTGPSSAKKGVIIVYDIFGYYPQTLQAADIVSSGDSENQYQVYIPDFFEGKPYPKSMFPPDNDERKKALGDFFASGGPGEVPKSLEQLSKIIVDLKQNTNIESWGIMGLCWGGKIVNLSTQSGTEFKAGVAAHPAMVDANDAADVSVPYLMIPSSGESKEDVKKWQDGLKVKNAVEWFPDNVHGFMSARANLSDEAEKKAYEKGYSLVLNWFHAHL